MKKSFLVAVAAIMFSGSAFAGVDFSIQPRLEGAYNSVANDHEFDFGGSQLYTFINGDITEHLSFDFSALLFNPHYKSLYEYESPCINGTWLTTAYLSYNRDLWGVDLGKVILNFGGLVNEENDIDCYSGLVPFGWMWYNTYQYGATLRLTPGENHSFEAQLTTSPSMETFKDMKLAYSLCWRGTMGNFSTVYAFNSVRECVYDYDEEEDEDIVVEGEGYNTFNIGLGNRYDFNDSWALELDAYLHLFDGEVDEFNYSDFSLSGIYNATDNLKFKLQTGIRGGKAFSLGGLVEYYPIESLRLHTAFNYCDSKDLYYPNKFNNDTPFEINFGVTYSFDFHAGR